MTGRYNRYYGRTMVRPPFRQFQRSVQRRYFIDNPRYPFRPPFRQIYFPPRPNFSRGRGRNNSRNPKNNIRIRFGQQQDLAFNGQVKTGMGNTLTTPVSESKTVESYFKFNNDTITLCQPLPSSFYSGYDAVIPIHPMYYYGRTSNIALNFGNFSVTKAIVHYVPLIGSTSTGMIGIGSTRKCEPLTHDTTKQFSALTQITAEIHAVWMCSKFLVKDLDSSLKNMAPISRNDIPNTAFVIGNGLAGTLAASCTLFVEMTIKLSRPLMSPALSSSSTSTVLTIQATGIASSVALATNTHGIVLASTATNIDVGEYIQLQACVVAGTEYPIDLFHNSIQTDVTNVAGDRGSVTILIFYEN